MKNTFAQEKSSSIDLLLSVRETATLQEIINLCSEKQAEMHDLNDEIAYFCIKERAETLEEIKNYCKEKINKLKENQ